MCVKQIIFHKQKTGGGALLLRSHFFYGKEKSRGARLRIR